MTKKYFPVLRDWISRFLDSNKDMTASEIGHNMLVEQVRGFPQTGTNFNIIPGLEKLGKKLEISVKNSGNLMVNSLWEPWVRILHSHLSLIRSSIIQCYSIICA